MGQRALIVDDAYFMRNLIKKVLKEAGYEIVGEAKNGAEGISLYFDLKPDFVTMDINMPDMSGIEVTRHILSKDPKANIIAVTGSDSDQVKEDMMAAGAKGYLKKPFQPAFLLTKIEEMFSPVEEIEETSPPSDSEVVVVQEQNEEEDDFFGKEIHLLTEPDKTRETELKIENNEDRIEFPQDDDSLESKEKYALVENEPAEPSNEEPNQGSSEEIDEEPFEEESFNEFEPQYEESDADKHFEQYSMNDNFPSNEDSDFLLPSKGDEADSQVHEQKEEVNLTPEPTTTEKVVEPPAVEEPHSYLQIRPPRGKVLSNPALHEQEQGSTNEDGELIINANGEVEQVPSQKKGFLSFFTNLFKIK